MAARTSPAAIIIFTRTRSPGRYQLAHHQRVNVEAVFMKDSIASKPVSRNRISFASSTSPLRWRQAGA